MGAHSYTGLSAFLAICLQWIMGFAMFLLPESNCVSLPESARRAWMPFHIILGISTLMLSASAVVSGIAEDEAFVYGCTNTGSYMQMSTECHLVDSLALTVNFAVMATLAALLLASHKSTAESVALKDVHVGGSDTKYDSIQTLEDKPA